MARRAGSCALLSLWPEEDPARIWLATTDADSYVPRDWLTVQMEAYFVRSGHVGGTGPSCRGKCDSAAVDTALFGRTGSGAWCESRFQRRSLHAAKEASAACAPGKIETSITGL